METSGTVSRKKLVYKAEKKIVAKPTASAVRKNVPRETRH